MLIASDVTCLVFLVLLSVALCLAVLSRFKWLAGLSYSLAAALFVVYILSAKTPWYDHLWVYIWPHPSAVICQMAAVWGPLIAVLIGLARHLGRPRDRRAVHLIAALVGGWAVYSVVLQLAGPDVNRTAL